MTIQEAIRTICDKNSLSRREAKSVFAELMSGRASPVQIAALLVSLRVKGESVSEIAGAVDAMREASIVVVSPTRTVVDTCGTGGDQKNSINVSTIAAFVVAGAGFVVAKHGNRSVSSRCGSADVLEAVGVSTAAGPDTVADQLREIGFSFLFAPTFHPAMKHAMPIRRELGLRTIFNVLGPLTNPAKPTVQIVGVYDPKWLKPVAEVLVTLGCKEGLVVHGQGFDEIILHGPTAIAEIVGGKIQMKTLHPSDFGLALQRLPPKHRGDATSSGKILLEVLSGVKGGARDLVCVNAAAAIRAALRRQRKTVSLREALQRAYESIDSGKALQKLNQLKGM